MPVSRRNLIVIPAFGLAQLAGYQKAKADGGGTQTPPLPERNPREALFTVKYDRDKDTQCLKLSDTAVYYVPADFVDVNIESAEGHLGVRITGRKNLRIVLNITTRDEDPNVPKFDLQPEDETKKCSDPEWENPLEDNQCSGLVGRLRVKKLPGAGMLPGFTLVPQQDCGDLELAIFHTSWHIQC